MDVPSLRVLVVGDSGVGKTMLLRKLCKSVEKPRNKVDKDHEEQHRWTIGCDVHVLHCDRQEHVNGPSEEMYVEFIDVGGHPKYDISRQVFYNDIQGVIFVYDLSNGRSRDNLKLWHDELVETQRQKGCVLPSYGAPGTIPSLNALPKLVIGNKKDLVTQRRNSDNLPSGLRHTERMETSAEPLKVDMYHFNDFLYRVVQFANRSVLDTRVDTSSSYHTNPSVSGLRQKSSRQVPF